MEIDLGLKITRDTDNHHQSSTDFHIAKDRAGPVFVSTETDSVFILSAHLKGFEKENIKININEDGTRMTISGEKLVSEMIMSGWRLYKREEEVKGFSKTFKIPDGVVLDKIRAKFGEGNFSLTIYMPKSEKGICGHGIEEVKEKEDEDTNKKGLEKEEVLKPADKKHPEKTEEDKRGQKSTEIKNIDQERKPGEQGGGNEHVEGEASKQQVERAEKSVQKEGEGDVVEKKSAIVAPSFLMGSAFIASLVVLVVGWVRINSTKKQ